LFLLFPERFITVWQYDGEAPEYVGILKVPWELRRDLVVLPILHKQQGGSGQDEEYLVPGRTDGLKAPSEINSVSADQTVGYGTSNQEETGPGLETATQASSTSTSPTEASQVVRFSRHPFPGVCQFKLRLPLASAAVAFTNNYL